MNRPPVESGLAISTRFWIMVYPDVPGVSLAFGNRALVVVGAHGRSLVAIYNVFVVAVFVAAAIVEGWVRENKWVVG